MCGYIAGVVLAGVRDGQDQNVCSVEIGNLLTTKCSLNWRLMLASPVSSCHFRFSQIRVMDDLLTS
jgi:hypothetical protein